MSEIRDQLIRYLQELIAKRLSENKWNSVTNLVGDISHFKEFKLWLQNNFRNEFRLNLLKFIQEDSHHFRYDFKTGTVSVNNVFECIPTPVSDSVVLKPKLLNDLSSDQSMDNIEVNSSVLELIIFVMKEVNNKSIHISDLIQSIGQNCGQQFNCYKSMVKIKDRKSESDFNHINEIILIQLLTTHLKPIFIFDYLQRTITMDTKTLELSQLMDCLTQTSLVVIKNCLVRQLYRFGRKYSFELNDWFHNKYEITSEYIVNRGLTLDLIFGLFPEVFNLQIVDQITRIVDLNPKLMGKTRSLELELMYKYGTEIRGGVGVITKVTESVATIECQIGFTINDQNFKPEFKVISELVQILGQQMADLRTFVHCRDFLLFDAKFITTFPEVSSHNVSNDLWLVTRIYSVRHTAQCYVHSILDGWKDGQWNTTPSEDTDDSCDLSYQLNDCL